MLREGCKISFLFIQHTKKGKFGGWNKCYHPSEHIKTTLQKNSSTAGGFSVIISTPWLSLEAIFLVIFPPPSLRGWGSPLAESFCPALSPPGLNGEHIPGRTKQWQLMTNGLSLSPHLPPHTSLPWRHQPAEAKRSRNIHEGQADGHRCWGDRYEPRSINLFRVGGGKQWDGKLGTKVQKGGLCPWG